MIQSLVEFFSSTQISHFLSSYQFYDLLSIFFLWSWSAQRILSLSSCVVCRKNWKDPVIGQSGKGFTAFTPISRPYRLSSTQINKCGSSIWWSILPSYKVWSMGFWGLCFKGRAFQLNINYDSYMNSVLLLLFFLNALTGWLAIPRDSPFNITPSRYNGEWGYSHRNSF